VQTVGFQLEYFAPFLPVAVAELVRLIGEADTFEGKRRISHSLNVVIEQAGSRVSLSFISLSLPKFSTQIVPFMAMIVGPLPQLCKQIFMPLAETLTFESGTEAGEQWLFKSSLLVTVTNLVEASTKVICPSGILMV
jgi:hypothetical protein